MDKQCTKCKAIKPVESFHKSSRSKDGRQYRCIECRRPASAARNKNLYQTSEAYRKQCSEYKKKYRKDNAAKISEYQLRYRTENKVKIEAGSKLWRDKNADLIRIKTRDRQRNRRRNDLEFRINVICKPEFTMRFTQKQMP